MGILQVQSYLHDLRPELDFADWLQGELDSRGWRVADLARATGLSHSHIGRILSKERLVGIDAARAIARLEKRREELLAVQEAVEIARRSAVNLGDQIRAVRKGMERAGLEKRRRLMEAINLRVALIGWDMQARKLTYRVTCGVGEPREFEIYKHR